MISEALHQSALVPLLAVALLGRRAPRAWWLVAAAFFVSWVGDSAAHFAGDAWWTAYAWLPVQFGLVLVAFLPTVLWRMVAVTGVLLLAVTSAQATAPGPDWMLTLGASVAILAAVKGPLSAPVVLYFGFGSLAYLWMVALIGSDRLVGAWWAYQGCRVAAYVTFVGLLIQQRRRAVWVPS
jgi:hypothetical protein